MKKNGFFNLHTFPDSVIFAINKHFLERFCKNHSFHHKNIRIFAMWLSLIHENKTMLFHLKKTNP